ncbi:hypothetical protein [Terrimonas pollutisoli]|uniref:hypothetical protein n=1 Tax=Terrimonas pollutisoli TaxID=3034147 RepID=UPI0023EC3484|nr:hypothetical protein [Terrimonas sp. H1YJ31]
MALQTEYKFLANEVKEIYVFDEEKDDEKQLVFRIDKRGLVIKFFPSDFCLKEITLNGFKTLPEEFSENGYIKQGLLYYINKKIEHFKPASFIIDKSLDSSIKKTGKKTVITLKYSDLEYFKEKMTNLSNENKRDRSYFADEFFYTTFPAHYPETKLSSQQRLNKLLSNLDKDVIERIGPADLEKIENFYETLLKTKYKSDAYKTKLITRTKVKIDTITVDGIIKEFEEKACQKYFRE